MKAKEVVMHIRTGFCIVAGMTAMCSLKAETQQSDCDVYMVTQDDGQFSSFTRGGHWSDGESPEETGSNKTYFIPSGKQLIAYPSTDMTFGGKMIACVGKIIAYRPMYVKPTANILNRFANISNEKWIALLYNYHIL